MLRETDTIPATMLCCTKNRCSKDYGRVKVYSEIGGDRLDYCPLCHGVDYYRRRTDRWTAYKKATREMYALMVAARLGV